MSRLDPVYPEMLTTDLRFPDTELPTADIPEDRNRTLVRQAFVLEFAANSVLTSYCRPEMGENLWIPHLAPLIVQFHRGIIPQRHASVAETRTVMAREFNDRIDDSVVSMTDHSRILQGLLAFEDPASVATTADALIVIHAAYDPDDVPGYISSGNNASAFLLQNFPGIDGDAVLKIGHTNPDELSGCPSQSAYTNLCRWLGLKAGEGIVGFEQPVAFSAEQPITITNFVPGIELFEISKLKNKPLPSEKALHDFANAFYEAIVRNIVIDVHGRDILYDPDEDRLTIIDHSAPSRAYSRRLSSYVETVDAIVETFKASFGYEFDEVAFERLLSEFARQGLHDLRGQV